MKKVVEKLYRIVLALVAVVATVTTFTDHVVAFGGDGNPAALYFTSWSVWLALISAILALVLSFNKKIDEKKGGGRAIRLAKFSANIMVIATFIVAAFVLPSKIWTPDYWTFGGIFKHFLLPILTILDAFLFDTRHVLKVFDPILAVITSLLYWVIVVIRFMFARANLGGAISEEFWGQYYPYGFTNMDNGHSIGGLCGMLGGILVGLILIGYVYYIVDHKGKKKKK